MGGLQTPIQLMRERLTGLLADWGAELSMVLKELEDKRNRLEALEASSAEHNDEITSLQRRIESQDELIDSMKSDGEQAAKLRKELHAKAAELEPLVSELASKKELIAVLRRDAEQVDRLKADAKLKDRELERLKNVALKAEQRAEQLGQEIEVLRESAAGRATEESAELEAVRAELDARKTLIKSLRADQERVAALEASLDEKREVIAQLEASTNRHANTIVELKRSAETWKRKYQLLKGGDSAATSAQLPAVSATDLRAMERLEREAGAAASDSTVAIDMRRSLLEARRTASRGQGEK